MTRWHTGGLRSTRGVVFLGQLTCGLRELQVSYYLKKSKTCEEPHSLQHSRQPPLWNHASELRRPSLALGTQTQTCVQRLALNPFEPPCGSLCQPHGCTVFGTRPMHRLLGPMDRLRLQRSSAERDGRIPDMSCQKSPQRNFQFDATASYGGVGLPCSFPIGPAGGRCWYG